jgi:hypothetical protein
VKTTKDIKEFQTKEIKRWSGVSKIIVIIKMSHKIVANYRKVSAHRAWILILGSFRWSRVFIWRLRVSNVCRLTWAGHWALLSRNVPLIWWRDTMQSYAASWSKLLHMLLWMSLAMVLYYCFLCFFLLYPSSGLLKTLINIKNLTKYVPKDGSSFIFS